MATESARHRLEGNDFYKKVTPDLAPTIRRGRLESAMRCYHKARNSASNDEDRMAAIKNLGIASWKTGCVLVQMEERVQTVGFFFNEAMGYLQSAIELGKSKPPAWIGQIKSSQIQCVEDFFHFCSSVDYKHRPRALEQFALKVPDSQKAEVYMELGNTLFKWAVTKQQSRDYHGCLGCLSDCYFPLEEAKRFGRDKESLLAEVEVLEQDINIQKCIAKSQQARKTGDDLFEQIVSDEEFMNYDMIWEIVDWYTQAILLTREHDLEMEAIAASRLGRLYDKVLKMKIKAKENFQRVLHLAHSMHPRLFTGDDWFKLATETIDRYQRETVLAEQEKWEQERAEYLKELKEELDELEAKCNKEDINHMTRLERCKEGLEVLEFIYKRFPPKNKSFKKPEVTNPNEFSQVKKALQKAVTHYHPDRQTRFGMKWKVMCEEICKELTKRYENFKG